MAYKLRAFISLLWILYLKRTKGYAKDCYAESPSCYFNSSIYLEIA